MNNISYHGVYHKSSRRKDSLGLSHEANTELFVMASDTHTNRIRIKLGFAFEKPTTSFILMFYIV